MDGKLRRTRIPEPQPPPTPYIVEDTLPDLPTLDDDDDVQASDILLTQTDLCLALITNFVRDSRS